MDKEDFFNILEEDLDKINLMIHVEQKEMFWKYMNYVLEWNEKINLTAITEPKEFIIKHFVDSLTIANIIEDNTKVIDIGSGAGFPGIPLKIMNDTLNMTLLDSLNKRVNFLNETIAMLNLTNIIAIHNRVEEFGKDKKYREKYDYATSRAVASLNVLVEYMLPTIKVGGECICMKGPDVDEEIEESKKAIEILGGQIKEVKKLTLPSADIQRKIIIIDKVKETPSKFPRKAGTPSKDPIK